MVSIGGQTYLTTSEVAQLTGLHRGSLANQRAAGRSPMSVIRVGRTVLYLETDVRRYAFELEAAR